VLVLERGADIGKIGQRRAPLRIHREGEIGLPQLVQHLLCLRLEAQLRRDERETGFPGIVFWLVVDQLFDDGGNLRQASLLTADCEHLHAVDAFDTLPMCSANHRIRVLGELLGRRELADQKRQHGLPELRNPFLLLHLTAFDWSNAAIIPW
jgi:hypothetical protein